MGLKSTGGEIVQVQGGHIIRATGRKDRHSKVFTAKGPRDRRVRLSAHTAIQFYDVQDRLGYDRPSKAVDWLINKAKESIDKLAELPPWDPTAAASASNSAAHEANVVRSNTQISLGDHSGSTQFYVPQCVDSQSLADSIKSFFPTSNNNSGDNSINFQNYPHELISRANGQSQDLCLSLHTDSGAAGSVHHHSHSGHHDQALYQGSGPMGFDSGWPGEQPHQQHDIGRFTRMMGWAGGGGGGVVEGRGGVLFNPPPLSAQALLLGQQGSAASYSQRSTLQSSFSPFARGLEDHNHNHHHNHQQQQQQQQSISGIGLGSDSFMGFCIPSQIHGELHGGASMSNRASSSSLSPDSSQH